ncbi:MAG TPA: hypothetical protein VIB47_03475, partial [Dehalococcoidia bacterium]
MADFYFINMAQPQISTFDRMKLVSPFVVAAVWLGLAAVALCFSYRPRSTALSWAKGCAIAGFPIANGLA